MARGRGAVSLDAEVHLQRGSLMIDVSLRADAGEVVALLGPNGAGKTSVLRVLAGLTELDAGGICVDGRVHEAPADNVLVTPDRRPIGMVFQDSPCSSRTCPRWTTWQSACAAAAGRGTTRGAFAATWLDRVGWPISLGRESARCPVGKRSGSRWRGAPSCSSQACCCSTSRSPPSTAGRASRCVRATPPPRRLPWLRRAGDARRARRPRARRPHRRDRARTRRRRGQRATPPDIHEPTMWRASLSVNLRRGTATPRALLSNPVDRNGTRHCGRSSASPRWWPWPTAVALHRSRPAGSPRNGWPATSSAWRVPRRGPTEPGGAILQAADYLGRGSGARARSRAGGPGRTKPWSHRVSPSTRVPIADAGRYDARSRRRARRRRTWATSASSVPAELEVSSEAPDRNLALSLSEDGAAMAAGRWVGRGDKNGADGAAVNAMRQLINRCRRTAVVIGEGEKDDAPMLFNGERWRSGTGPRRRRGRSIDGTRAARRA